MSYYHDGYLIVTEEDAFPARRDVRVQRTTKLDEFRAQADSLTRQLARVNERLAIEESIRIPDEPTGKGDLFIKFEKYFTGKRRYVYTAVKPKGSNRWSVSGKTSMVNEPWDNLIEFIQYNESDRQRALDSVVELKTKKPKAPDLT